MLDVAGAGLGLLALSPALAVIAVLIRVTSRGPVLFRQTRLTAGRREFTIYKFRTMRKGTGGPEVTARGDARITAIGRFLRRTSLDELPQLLNVLRGDMTLVGPRPETPALAEKYPADLQWIFDHTPGLTGPTQVRLRDMNAIPEGVADAERWYIEQLVPARVAMDLTYLSEPSIRATVKVLVDTVEHLRTGESPEAGPSARAAGHSAH